MIKSMTGYGSAESVTDRYTLKIEIRSLNSKFLDLLLKAPKEFGDKELEMKSLVGSHLVRGKISLALEFALSTATSSAVSVNEELFKSYYDQFDKLADTYAANRDELFKLALHAPGVLEQDEDIKELIDWPSILSSMKEAIAACDKFRVDEGTKLEAALRSNIDSIQSGLERVNALDEERVRAIRTRLEQAIDEIKDRVKVDINRFEQELIYYLEKLDISEEKVRLQSHLTYFLEVLDGPESNGKKLGFISQEIGREINTIGSKSNHAEMQRVVVQMKDDLEQIKEQVLNVL